MAYNNFTVSDFNFNETQGDDLSTNGTIRLTITPDDGYIVLASDFSLIAPFPAGIDPSSVSFQQSGSLVFLDVNFLAGTIMPCNDVEVPLCLNGFARFAPYSVEGIVNLGTQNATPVSQQYAYSQTGDFTQTKLVWNQTIQANAGFYFYQAPIAAINTGDPSAYSIITTETLNQYNELIAVTYDINYTFPANSVTGDIINIQALAIPSVGNTTYINAFNVSGVGNFNQPPIPNAGDTRVLNLFGDPTATFSASLFYQDGTGTEIIIATNEVMPSNGQYSSPNIVFPPSADGESPYKIIITGDINPATANPGSSDITLSFAQTEEVTFTISAFSSSGDYNVSGSPDTFIAVPNYTYQPGDQNSFEYQFMITAANGNDVSKLADHTASSFNPVIPDPANPGTLYSLSNPQTINGQLGDSVKVKGTITIQATQDVPIAHALDVDTFIQDDGPPGPGAWIAALCVDPSDTILLSTTQAYSIASGGTTIATMTNSYAQNDVVWAVNGPNDERECRELITIDLQATPTNYLDERANGNTGKYSDCSGPNMCVAP